MNGVQQGGIHSLCILYFLPLTHCRRQTHHKIDYGRAALYLIVLYYLFDVMSRGFLPTAARLGKPRLLSLNANYVVALNNKYCEVWHEKRFSAEANEAEGPDADGLPTSWWETLILRPQQTGRPCLDKWFSSSLVLRQQGCGAVAPVCPQAGGWGPWFCQNGARQTTR